MIGRALGFLLAGWVALVVSSALRLALPWRVPVPELALLIVLYVGLTGRGAPSLQLFMALALGYLEDLFSGAPRGLHMLALGVIMLGAHAASSRLLVASRWQKVAVTLFALCIHGVLLAGLAAPATSGLSEQPSMLDRLRPLPWAGLLTAALAPLVFNLCARLDRRLWPLPRGLGKL